MTIPVSKLVFPGCLFEIVESTNNATVETYPVTLARLYIFGTTFHLFNFWC